MQQLACLRIAVILCHARREPELKGLALGGSGTGLALTVPAAWAKAYPQSAHLLREEVLAWQKTPWTFAVHFGSPSIK
jgi:exopolyphosphatase/guanosine-5'-triphosphate,3'-diphosphate pyrophosphatase